MVLPRWGAEKTILVEHILQNTTSCSQVIASYWPLRVCRSINHISLSNSIALCLRTTKPFLNNSLSTFTEYWKKGIYRWHSPFLGPWLRTFYIKKGMQINFWYNYSISFYGRELLRKSDVMLQLSKELVVSIHVLWCSMATTSGL